MELDFTVAAAVAVLLLGALPALALRKLNRTRQAVAAHDAADDRYRTWSAGAPPAPNGLEGLSRISIAGKLDDIAAMLEDTARHAEVHELDASLAREGARVAREMAGVVWESTVVETRL